MSEKAEAASPPASASIAPPPRTTDAPPPTSSERAITLFRSRVRRCWNSALAVDPNTTLAADIDLHVATDGTVTNITTRPRGQGARNTSLIACIEEGARKVVFEPRDAPATLTIPLVLTKK